jgi:hypothetical protein
MQVSDELLGGQVLGEVKGGSEQSMMASKRLAEWAESEWKDSKE